MFVKVNSIFSVSIPCDIPNGGAFTQPTTFFTSVAGSFPTAVGVTLNSSSQTGGGSYWTAQVTIDTTAFAIAGDLVVLAADAAGNTVGSRAFQMVPWDPFDANLGLPLLDVAISSRGTASPGDNMGLTLAALGVLFDGTNSLQDFLKAVAAVLAGQETTTGPTTVFKNWPGTKDVVTLNATPGGNRTPATFDFS